MSNLSYSSRPDSRGSGEPVALWEFYLDSIDSKEDEYLTYWMKGENRLLLRISTAEINNLNGTVNFFVLKMEWI